MLKSALFRFPVKLDEVEKRVLVFGYFLCESVCNNRNEELIGAILRNRPSCLCLEQHHLGEEMKNMSYRNWKRNL